MGLTGLGDVEFLRYAVKKFAVPVSLFGWVLEPRLLA
jgi:hypothetical protein